MEKSHCRDRQRPKAAIQLKYHDGSTVTLGDIVSVLVGPEQFAKARVVMLGDTYEHLDIDDKFLSWVRKDKVLKRASVVVEWLGPNPFAHDDPGYAPVGNYMFSPVDAWLKRDV